MLGGPAKIGSASALCRHLGAPCPTAFTGRVVGLRGGGRREGGLFVVLVDLSGCGLWPAPFSMACQVASKLASAKQSNPCWNGCHRPLVRPPPTGVCHRGGLLVLSSDAERTNAPSRASASSRGGLWWPAGVPGAPPSSSRGLLPHHHHHPWSQYHLGSRGRNSPVAPSLSKVSTTIVGWRHPPLHPSPSCGGQRRPPLVASSSSKSAALAMVVGVVGRRRPPLATSSTLMPVSPASSSRASASRPP